MFYSFFIHTLVFNRLFEGEIYKFYRQNQLMLCVNNLFSSAIPAGLCSLPHFQGFILNNGGRVAAAKYMEVHLRHCEEKI